MHVCCVCLLMCVSDCADVFAYICRRVHVCTSALHWCMGVCMCVFVCVCVCMGVYVCGCVCVHVLRATSLGVILTMALSMSLAPVCPPV